MAVYPISMCVPDWFNISAEAIRLGNNRTLNKGEDKKNMSDFKIAIAIMNDYYFFLFSLFEY